MVMSDSRLSERVTVLEERADINLEKREVLEARVDELEAAQKPTRKPGAPKPAFKKGDRVKIVGPAGRRGRGDDRHRGKVGEITGGPFAGSLFGLGPSDYAWVVRGDDFHGFWYIEDSLELVEEPKPAFKVGDRVKVVGPPIPHIAQETIVEGQVGRIHEKSALDPRGWYLREVEGGDGFRFGHYLPESLEPVEEPKRSFKKGDRVKIVGPPAMHPNTKRGLGKISTVYGKSTLVDGAWWVKEYGTYRPESLELVEELNPTTADVINRERFKALEAELTEAREKAAEASRELNITRIGREARAQEVGKLEAELTEAREKAAQEATRLGSIIAATDAHLDSVSRFSVRRLPLAEKAQAVAQDVKMLRRNTTEILEQTSALQSEVARVVEEKGLIAQQRDQYKVERDELRARVAELEKPEPDSRPIKVGDRVKIVGPSVAGYTVGLGKLVTVIGRTGVPDEFETDHEGHGFIYKESHLELVHELKVGDKVRIVGPSVSGYTHRAGEFTELTEIEESIDHYYTTVEGSGSVYPASSLELVTDPPEPWKPASGELVRIVGPSVSGVRDHIGKVVTVKGHPDHLGDYWTSIKTRGHIFPPSSLEPATDLRVGDKVRAIGPCIVPRDGSSASHTGETFTLTGKDENGWIVGISTHRFPDSSLEIVESS